MGPIVLNGKNTFFFNRIPGSFDKIVASTKLSSPDEKYSLALNQIAAAAYQSGKYGFS